MVARARRHAGIGQIELGGDRRDDRLRAVAAGHREPVGAAGDRIAHELLEVPGRAELDRLDPARPRFCVHREALRLAAAGLGVEEQHRPLRRRHLRQVRAEAERRPAHRRCSARARRRRVSPQAGGRSTSSTTAAPSPSAPIARPAIRAAPRRRMPYQIAAAATATHGQRDGPRGNSCDRDDDREAERAEAESRAPIAASRLVLIGSPVRGLAHRRPEPPASGPARWLEDAERLDVGALRGDRADADARARRAMARLSRAADCSRLSLPRPPCSPATGGRRGGRPPRGPGVGRGDGGHRQPRHEAARPPPPPRPRGRGRYQSPGTCECPPRRRSLPATPLPPSRSRPVSATCSRQRRSRCVDSQRSSRTRGCTRGAFPGRRRRGRADRHHARPAHNAHARTPHDVPSIARCRPRRPHPMWVRSPVYGRRTFEPR